MTDIDQHKIHAFNETHSVTERQQFRALVEEVGECAEALNTDADDTAVSEELADIIFVVRSLAELRDINISQEVNSVIAENREKNTATEGEKVTKQGLTDTSASDYDYEITD